MRGLAAGVVVFLASGCMVQTSSGLPPAQRSVQVEECDDPVPGPGKLPGLVTTGALRAWADKTDEAREENARRLRLCGKRLRKASAFY